MSHIRKTKNAYPEYTIIEIGHQFMIFVKTIQPFQLIFFYFFLSDLFAVNIPVCETHCIVVVCTSIVGHRFRRQIALQIAEFIPVKIPGPFSRANKLEEAITISCIFIAIEER